MAEDNSLIELSAHDSIPLSSAGTGTITSINGLTDADKLQIQGTGTAFLSELSRGEHIYIQSQNAFAEVSDIVDDENLYIKKAFPVALSGSAFRITPRPKYTEISIDNVGAGAVVVDGVSRASGSPALTFSRAGQSSGWQKRRFDPIDIDASATTVHISLISK